MKYKFFSLCFLIAICNLAKSQTVPTPQKIVKPKTFKLKLENLKSWNSGFLSGINDSKVQLSSERATFSSPLIENPFYKTFTYNEIERIKIRKHGSVGRGIGYGALIGAGVGAIVGLAAYKKPAPEDDFLSGLDPVVETFVVAEGVIIGSFVGATIGGLIGSKNRKFFIHGNKEKFNEMKTSVLEMALGKSGQAAKDSSSTNYVPPSLN